MQAQAPCNARPWHQVAKSNEGLRSCRWQCENWLGKLSTNKSQTQGTRGPATALRGGTWTHNSNNTVRVISPVQSEHTCSEMRYCTHRDQCPWRCFTARQDNKHTLVGLSRPPRKANVAPGKCRSTIPCVDQGVCQNWTAVNCSIQF